LTRFGMTSAALVPLVITLSLFSAGGPWCWVREGYLSWRGSSRCRARAGAPAAPDRRPLEVVAITLFGSLRLWLPSFAPCTSGNPLPVPFAGEARGSALLVYRWC